MIAQALATEGLWLLFLAAGIAGLVRGFSGFGTAMIYLPLAAQVLPPVWVLITLLAMDTVGTIPAVPRAVRDGRTSEVFRLMVGALIAMPVGLLLLVSMPAEVFRYGVTGLTLVLLVLLVLGMRYRGVVGKKMTFGVGGAGGLLCGAVGLPGPPVIFFYMARPLPVSVIRANVLLYLFLSDILLAILFWGQGLVEMLPLIIGLMVMPIYGISIRLGTLIFDPSRGSVYRWVAYGIIAASAVSGLPIWD